jgi:hypothetical protein
MVSLIESGYGWLCKTVPYIGENYPLPTGMNRNLAYLFIANFFFNLGPDQGRYEATIATLGLQGKISDDTAFSKWIGTQKTTEDSEQILVLSQMPDLICKVIAAASFILTRNISLIDTLTKIVSHSQVPKVALPVIKGMANLPVPRPLQSAYVIALAPVVAKLIQIALIYADPKGENSSLENIKSGANRVSQGLEFLLHLRYSLVCLGISKTFYHTIAKTVFYISYNYVFNHFAPEIFKSFKGIIPFFLYPSETSKTRWNNFLDLITNVDYWPTSGFETGLKGMYNSFYNSSAPYDLEGLFNQANGLTGTLNDLGKFRTDIETARSNITKAQKEGKISKSLAAHLNALVEQKTLEKLETFLLNPNFAAEVDTNKDAFLDIYWPTSAVTQYLEYMSLISHSVRTDRANAFVDLLKEINTATFNAEDLIENDTKRTQLMTKVADQRQSESLTQELTTVCANVLRQKQKETFNRTILPNLLVGNLDEVTARIKKIRIYLQTKGDNFDDIRKKVFDAVLGYFPANIQDNQLLSPDEANLMALYGNKGLIHAFATTPQEKYQAYLLSTHFLLKRFSLNLRWYMENRPADQDKKVQYEYLLLHQLMRAQFDYDQIVESPGYSEWAKERYDYPSLIAMERVKIYMFQSVEFDFARDIAFPIPNDFVFSTYTLPFILDSERRQVNSSGDTFASARNFEAEFKEGLTDTGLPPTLPEQIRIELSALQKLYPNQDLRDVFVPSADIRRAAN